MMMIPGVIAFHLYGGPDSASGLTSIDLAYPQLIRDVLPNYASGFFLAVLLGAVFSSFNSLLNSAATLFCLDVYEFSDVFLYIFRFLFFIILYIFRYLLYICSIFAI